MMHSITLPDLYKSTTPTSINNMNTSTNYNTFTTQVPNYNTNNTIGINDCNGYYYSVQQMPYQVVGQQQQQQQQQQQLLLPSLQYNTIRPFYTNGFNNNANVIRTSTPNCYIPAINTNTYSINDSQRRTSSSLQQIYYKNTTVLPPLSAITQQPPPPPQPSPIQNRCFYSNTTSSRTSSSSLIPQSPISSFSVSPSSKQLQNQYIHPYHQQQQQQQHGEKGEEDTDKLKNPIIKINSVKRKPHKSHKIKKIKKDRKLNRKNICVDCGKRFARPSSLITHRNIHTGIKPFVCRVDDCTKAFNVRSNMIRHEKTHERKKLKKQLSNIKQIRL